jgi:hypothetical protein
MRTVAHPAPALSIAALDGGMLEVECWRIVAASETTGATPKGADPLRPARDPVNAGRTVRVEWAGRCEGCHAPMWAAVMPARADLTRERRRCPGCSGAPVFRFWHVLRQRPPSVPGIRGNGPVAGRVGEALADPPKQRGFEMGFVTSGTRPRARRGGRPRIYAAPAARQRAYRARRRLVLIPAVSRG